MVEKMHLTNLKAGWFFHHNRGNKPIFLNFWGEKGCKYFGRSGGQMEKNGN